MNTIRLFLLILFIPALGYCCDCVQNIINTSLESPKNSADNSECILIGRISNLNVKEQTFEVTVIESLDGSDIQGNRYLGRAWTKCTAYIEKEGVWIIYADLDENAFLRTNISRISRSFDMFETVPSNTKQHQNTNLDSIFLLLRKDYLFALSKEINALRERKYSLLKNKTLNTNYSNLKSHISLKHDYKHP